MRTTVDLRPMERGDAQGQRADGYRSLLQPMSREIGETLAGRYGDLGGVSVLELPVECLVCVEEAEALQRRRKREDEEVLALDSSSIADGDSWFLIDAHWLGQWGAFKGGSGPPPGPISNHRLFVGGKPEGAPRTGLSRGVHYRGVNERVWNYFHGIYGGGPVIKRKTISL